MLPQLSGAQVVPTAYFWQAPAPSHLLLVPQVLAPWSTQVLVGSGEPAATLVQVPADAASAHDRQAPVQALLQQKPWAQKVDWHSLPAVHGWPFSLGPHVPFTQARPVSQSALVLHVLGQAPAPFVVTQRNGLQFWIPCGRQVPSPSQVPAVLSFAPLQVGVMHWVSAAYLAHPPKPSHAPVLPQLAGPMSLQIPRGSAAPRSTGQQVPMR